MKKLGIRLAILLILIVLKTLTAKAEIVPEWYDSGVGDNTKTVLEVTCKGKPHRLLLKKDEIVLKNDEIIKWFDKIKNLCEGVK